MWPHTSRFGIAPAAQDGIASTAFLVLEVIRVNQSCSKA
jgi:hypothetical protein